MIPPRRAAALLCCIPLCALATGCSSGSQHSAAAPSSASHRPAASPSSAPPSKAHTVTETVVMGQDPAPAQHPREPEKQHQEHHDAAPTAPASGDTGGSCKVSALNKGSGMPLTVMYCDGTWAKVGKPSSDRLAPLHFDGKEWNYVEADGEGDPSIGEGDPCWDRQKVRAQGAPEEVFEGSYCTSRDHLKH